MTWPGRAGGTAVLWDDLRLSGPRGMRDEAQLCGAGSRGTLTPEPGFSPRGALVTERGSLTSAAVRAGLWASVEAAFWLMGTRRERQGLCFPGLRCPSARRGNP